MWKGTLALFGLVGLALATGTAGSLDPDFGTDGVVVASNDDAGQMNGVAALGDGSVVAVGQALNPQRWRIRGFAADGSADSSFDSAADLGIEGGVARRVVVDGSGKIVVAGNTTIQKTGKGGKTTTVAVTALVRLFADGSLDTSFGAGGTALTEPTLTIQALALQPDGKILLGGGNGAGLAIRRYNANGTLDTGFGSGGTKIDDVRKSAADDILGIAVQSTGKIVVACRLGATNNTPAALWALRRYASSGSLDTSFGTSGMATSAGDSIRGVAVDSEDRIVAAGAALNAQGQSDAGLVIRYTSGGGVDSSFGSSGEFVTGISGIDDFHRVWVVVGDAVLLLGRYGSPQNMYAARLDADGVADTAFGTDGFGDVVQSDEIADMAVDADGNAVAGGRHDSDNWLLARWLGN
jgi:uncharacterized delta-60 repeat protein